MSSIIITVDADTLMDADPGTWSSTPPDMDSLKAALAQRGGDNQPWMMSILYTIATVAPKVLMGQDAGDTTIAVATRADGYDMSVTTT